MTQPEHNPKAATALTKPNLEKIPPISNTKLETFVQTRDNLERLALGIPSRAPQTDMKVTLESWEEEWERIEQGINKYVAV
jgi:hypothetical protein